MKITPNPEIAVQTKMIVALGFYSAQEAIALCDRR